MSFEIPFSHIAEIIMGQSPKGEEVNNKGIGLPLLNGPTEFTDRYPVPVQHTAFAKKTSLPGDVLFCVRGSTTGRMNYSDQKYCIGRGLAAIRGRNGYPTPYVKAVLETCLPELLAAATGSTFPNVSKDLINNIPVNILPVENACNISKLIELQEEKVFTNNQINQTLEQMAQALFKSWFVDFEPVKAKMAVLEEGGSHEDATLAAMTAISGKDADALEVFEREHPKKYAELKSTAELFPSAMQVSDQGFIPEGWEYRKIGDYIDNISKTYPLKKVEQVVFLNTGDIKEGIFLHQNKSDVVSLPGQAKKSIREGDILYSEIRPVNKRFAYVYFNADEYVVSTKLMVLRPKSKELSYYLYFLLSSNGVVSYLQLMAESRSGTFPQITYDTVSDIKILTSPDESVIKSFCKFLGENLYIPQQSIIKQNNMLTNIRDTLFPKLLSGEITLPEAEQAVSEAENV